MKDRLGRNIEYLRLSITDRCNLRCVYCMGDKNIKFLPREEILNPEEIKDIVEIFADLGVEKIRITGGEPLVRNNFREIVTNIRDIKKIEEISITTNGIKLLENIEFLKEKSINSINVSLDTLKPDLYREITGGGDLNLVLSGIYKALELGIKRVKINVVIIKGKNQNEIMDFVRLTEKYPIDVRFIELMPIGVGKEYCGISNDEIKKEIEKTRTFTFVNELRGSGPAVYYKTEEGKGCIGFINPLSHNFCEYCNRVRITPEGYLKLCLHWKDGVNLKEIIRDKDRKKELKSIIENAIYNKPSKHQMNEKDGKDFEERTMNGVGG